MRARSGSSAPTAARSRGWTDASRFRHLGKTQTSPGVGGCIGATGSLVLEKEEWTRTHTLLHERRPAKIQISTGGALSFFAGPRPGVIGTDGLVLANTEGLELQDNKPVVEATRHHLHHGEQSPRPAEPGQAGFASDAR